QTLEPTVVPAELRTRVPADFSALTDLWEDPQGPLGASSKRLILFAPDGPGWSDISSVWENVVHHPPRAAGGPGLSFGFNLGKIPGQGEDSDPTVRDGRELGLVAVFDGMGGAGG